MGTEDWETGKRKMIKDMLSRKKDKRKRFIYKAVGLAETIVALGIAGSAIFAMLYLAAKTAKQARANQERFIGAQAAADGVSLVLVAKGALKEYVCDTGSANVGILALADNPNAFVILPTNTLKDITYGEEVYRLLPQNQNEDTGLWEECANCNEDTAYLFRGLDIQRVEPAGYWSVKSITWWKVFGTPEITIIETRLPDGCE